uniref:Integrase n=1 Tax=Dulem virus 40 TaxID=3145758 RepID=A0AAU8AV14_9CAUD
MATLSLNVERGRTAADGSIPIRIKITSKNTKAYIATRYKVEGIKNWNGAAVVRQSDAVIINKKLRELLTAYENIVDTMPSTDAKAGEIKAYIESRCRKSDFLKDYAEQYIARLENEGRKSYAQNMGYTLRYVLECFGENISLQTITAAQLEKFENFMRKRGDSDTTINIRMSHLKALLNAAVNDGTVEYKIFPFRNYKIPSKAVRDICISKAELQKLRETEFKGVSERRHTVARDLFMLSFYCAGINLTDLMYVRLDGDTITFVRKKTATKKRGEKEVSITIQPEARTIIDKYITDDGKLDFGYNYRDYEQFRSFVTKGLNKIGEDLGFEKKLMYYSARKTFVQYGTDLGIPLYILEYAIGQTIKDANKRPIHDYFKVMRSQADMAIRTIISYSMDMEDEEAPIPEWAKKYVK